MVSPPECTSVRLSVAMKRVTSDGATRPFAARVSPRTLTRLGARTASLALLARDDADREDDRTDEHHDDHGLGRCVVSLWPHEALDENELLLDAEARESCAVRFGDHVRVEPLAAKLALAAEVRLVPTLVQDRRRRRQPLSPLDAAVLRAPLAAHQRVLVAGQVLHMSLHGRPFRVRVSHLVPLIGHDSKRFDSPLRVVSTTRITLDTGGDDDDDVESNDTTTSPTRSDRDSMRLAGYVPQSEQLRSLLRVALDSSDKSERLRQSGLGVARGALLYGPPGTGKTLLARTVAREFACTFVAVNGSEVVSKFYGESERQLRRIFARALTNQPALIFLDEIDALAPSSSSGTGGESSGSASSDMQRRVVAALGALVDSLADESATRVFVLGATNRPNAVDQSLRRPGRLDREIEIGVPTVVERRLILDSLLARDSGELCLTDDERHQIVERFAPRTHGYVGADLVALCKEARLAAFRQAGERPTKLSVASIEAAFGRVQPSAMRELVVDVPEVRWGDIGGQELTKQQLREAVEWPLAHPEAFARMGIRPPRGILLYGPPGCSKTMLAKALATESGLNFIAVKGPELLSMWVGESERAVRELFRKARLAAPSVVFFDEIDALAPRRSASGDGDGGGATERVLTQLLQELDGVAPLRNVVVVAATNRPDMLDDALLRPGRMDRKIYVAPPDLAARARIFELQLKRAPHDDDVDVESLASRTAGYTGAEIVALCREASLCALHESLDAERVCARHFVRALEIVRPRLTAEQLQLFKRAVD